MKRDIGLYFEDMVDAIRKIEEYIAGFSMESFLDDEKTQDAVTRNIEIIGEAVKLKGPF